MHRSVMDPAGFYRRLPLQPHQMVERLTPAEDVIVLCHLGVPRIDRASWSLTIDGLVENTRLLGFDDLLRYRKHTVTSVHQCAGSPLAPTEPTRRVSNVTWGGVRLDEVLADCRVKAEAQYVCSSGVDHGAFGGVTVDRYLKDLPIGRISADVLLAYELNGAPLPPENGFPVRLVVPGFYGTNSVKWISHISLEHERARSPFTTRYYNDPILDEAGRDTGRTQPVWSIAPESVIVAPAPDEKVARGAAVEIWGWAWADAGVASIAVFADDRPLDAVLEARAECGWQRFGASWRPDRAGPVTLRSVATARDGVVQPAHGWRNAVHNVAVMVS
jgi:DMSO/TMAO reductase YedYZ molybdopterin-dependent catalytic subunit